MSAVLDSFSRAANDPRMRKAPRVVPIITLPQTQRNSAWLPALGLLLVVTGGICGGGALWWNVNGGQFPVLPPLPSFAIKPVASQAEQYPEVITPPPVDVIVPPAVVALPLPQAEVQAEIQPVLVPPAVVQGIDPVKPPADTASIVLPASILGPQNLPVPAPTVDPAIAAVAEKIGDEAALTPPPAQQTGTAQISVRDQTSISTGHLLEDANGLAQSGDSRAAIVIYDHILAHDDASRMALAGKAYALAHAGHYDEAIAVDRHLLALAPQDENARAALAAHLAQSTTPKSQEELEKMVAAAPDFAPAQMALAHRLAQNGDMLDALPHVQSAVRMAPDDIRYRLDLAIFYDRLGHSSEAVDLYEQVLKAATVIDHPADLPLSAEAIRQRVGYLETLIVSMNGQP
jgi:Flp pilus assembly protein TadD